MAWTITWCKILRCEICQMYTWEKAYDRLSYNENLPRHKLWVCFQLIIWFEDYPNVGIKYQDCCLDITKNYRN